MAESYSKLPEELEAMGIEDLADGEMAFTVPWSIWVKRDKSAMINGSYSFSSEPHGTSSMRVKRSIAEVLVDLDSLKDEKFSPSDNPPHMGAKPEDYLPVRFVRGNFEEA